jgi:hypothetical protein
MLLPFGILGLGEMMNVPGVLSGDADVLKKLGLFKIEQNIIETRYFVLKSRLDIMERLELMSIVDDIRQIANYCEEIAEVILNKTFPRRNFSKLPSIRPWSSHRSSLG